MAVVALERRASKVDDSPLVKLHNAGLSEANGEIIAQGFLDFEGIRALKVDDYQREKLTGRGGGKLQKALEEGVRFPNITLGLRGSNYQQRGTTMTLDGSVYIIDGLQRISAIIHYIAQHPDAEDEIQIGAEVRFGTDKEKEKRLFHVLNLDRTRMSTNVILRNSRDDYKSVLTLYGLSHNKESALYKRVQWNQAMARGELITGVQAMQVANALLKHVSISGAQKGTAMPYGGRGGGVVGVMSQVEKRAASMGLENFRRTISAFWETIDEIYGIRSIEYATKATWLRGNFLIALANLFSSHTDFWEGNKLFIDADAKRKLRSFAVNDPEIQRLAGAGSNALPTLYHHLVTHFNKGKKVHRLKLRAGAGDEGEE